MNLVLVINPDNRRVKWWRIGPWLRQHDPEFEPGGTIVLFNNNIYGRFNYRDRERFLAVPRVSNILRIRPETDDYKVIYGGRKGQEMLTIYNGGIELTSNGNFLITETEGGRVFEIDVAGNVVWQYVNRYDEDLVAEVTGARLYPKNYFHVSDWSCEGRR